MRPALSDTLPGQKARLSTARWLLWGHLVLSILGVVLHLAFSHIRGHRLNGWYIGMTLFVALGAALALRMLNRSLRQAMTWFATFGTLYVVSILVHEVERYHTFTNIFYMFHVGVFSLGLILGFRAALLYAGATTLILSTMAVVYRLDAGPVVLAIVLAYGIALPSRVVELVIQESTQELNQMNRRLKREVAERKQMEQELSAYRDHLEELVQARTAELEANNEELNAFAHTAAHDLKNPLTKIVGFSSVLENDFTEMPVDEVRHYLHIVSRNGRKLGNIVDELLLLATVRQLEDIDRHPLDMAELVSSAQERLSDLIAERQATIITPPDWPPALGYGPWVEEVWVNYLSNALKYGGHPEEGVPPSVELGYSTSNAGSWFSDDADPDPDAQANAASSHIAFWVRDNGPGFSHEEVAQLFEPFTRLTRVRAKGHGLGLSIVRRIVHKLNGEVGIWSTVGEGSTFVFTLPAAPPDAAD
jgi:signal transduction histidine kinase